MTVSRPGVCFVFVGARPPSQIQDSVQSMAPLVAAMLRAEAHQVRARAELDTTREEAERAMRVKDEFLAMLGHELRNPLAPIVTALQMLRLEGVQARALGVLERQVAHVLRLVDDLLDVSRITRGKIALQREALEIATAVTRAVEMSRPILEQRRSDLRLEVPDQGLLVHGDPARLGQVISNLLTNAAKYSDPATRILVRAERAGPHVRVTVQDQGIGIDPPDLDRVFEQFVQTRQGIDRAEGGLGLGLAIVRSLVTMHEGTVRVFSEGRGRGSSFVVDLPVCGPGVVAAVPRGPVVSPASAPMTRMVSVLVVDDNLDAGELLGEVLTEYGYRVCFASSGPRALEALASFTPDAAVLDIGLPVMDGYELARRLREQLPDIRLVALTGYGQPNDRDRAREAGFDVHLVKPVSIEGVTQALERLLR